MAKRRKKTVNIRRKNISEVLIKLGILFTIVLFILKITIGSMGWIGVFSPILTAFFIVFMLSVLKAMFRKI